MAETVNQPTLNPTNKLTAATAAASALGILVSITSLTLKNKYPEWYDPDLIIMVASGVPPIAAFVAGWLTRDRPNVTPR